MVKITIKPWEEVIIHESIHHTVEELIQVDSIGVQPGGLAPALLWAEGILFRQLPLPPTESVSKEMLEGRIHMSGVEWAEMPNYQPALMIGDINARIPVINVSSNAILCDVAKTLKATARK